MTAPLRDPAGLVARCPELAELAGRSPSLKNAIERGRPFDAYRALFFAQLLGRFGQHRGVAASLLAQRRLFLRPLTRTPVLATVNGVGARIYGEADRDPEDGTSVATHYLVVVFIPVFPLSAYLVRPSPANPGRAWNFLAKVPLSTAAYLWQRVAALALLVLIASGAAHAFDGYRNNTLYVVNGFDLPVTAELAGSTTAKIPAHDHAEIHARTGSHRLVVRAEERVVEEADVTVPSSHTTAVWNILGVAPVALVPVVYSSDASKSGGGEKAEVLCGTESFEHATVDYRFSDPPKSIDMPSGSSATVRTHLVLAPGDTYACVHHLAANGDSTTAARLGVRISRALMIPAREIEPTVRELISTLPAAEADAFTSDLLQRDDGIDAHRLYQDTLLASDRRDRAVHEYDARLASHPGPDSEYLALRVKTHVEERARVDALVSKYPTHGFLLRTQLWSHYIDADFAVVAEAADRIRELDRARWSEVVNQHVEALVALGKGALARERLRESPGPEAAERVTFSLLDFRVAHVLTPDGEPEPPSPPSPESAGWWEPRLRAEAGLTIRSSDLAAVHDDDFKIALAIVDDARSVPTKALDRVTRSDISVIRGIPGSVATMLLAEAVRIDDASATQKLGAATGKLMLRAVTEYLKTGVSEVALGLSLEQRAALDFVRSRMLGLSEKERADARERAAREDVLKGPVSVAMAGWKP